MTQPEQRPQRRALPRSPRRSVWREPTIWFILLATCVHVIRQNLVDVLVFSGTAALIVVDGRRRDVHSVPVVGRIRPPVVAAVCAAYLLLVLPLSRTGWPLAVTIALPGLVALALVWRVGRSPLELASRPARATGRAWLCWPVLLVVGCLFELVNFALQPNPQTDSYAHPTISALVDPALGWAPARAVVAAVWLAIGFWLVRTIVRGGPREER